LIGYNVDREQMKPDLQRKTEELFHKILSGTAGKEEMRDFYQSLEHDKELRTKYHHYKNLFVLGKREDQGQVKIKPDGFEKFWKQAHPPVYRRIPRLLKYAAIVLFALACGYFVRTFRPADEAETLVAQQVEYSSKKGSISSVHLEDSSIIWLSSDTRISIEKFPDGRMTAHLEGEAYFDLVPDPGREFLVDLGPIIVKDIGTAFNIRSYEDEQDISVTLEKGKLDVMKRNHEPLLSVAPGELVRFDKVARSMTVTEKDPAVVSAWKDGKFVFIDQALSEISRELENWYDIEIKICDQKLASTRYTSVVQRTSTVDYVLKMLALTDNVQYKIINREGKCDKVEIYCEKE
jgi:ferric-dicitrate binding protein FerR (iron transport regulator)